MVTKIKIKVHADGVRLTLPSLPLSLLSVLTKIAGKAIVHQTKKQKPVAELLETDDVEVVDAMQLSQMQENKNLQKAMDTAVQILQQAKPMWKELEPFTLVEVLCEEDGTDIKIEMR